jgi:hypothetical protein
MGRIVGKIREILKVIKSNLLIRHEFQVFSKKTPDDLGQIRKLLFKTVWLIFNRII